MRLAELLVGISNRLVPDYQPAPALTAPAGLEETLGQALREWRAAQQYFDAVTEPGLVDHAIYVIRAAEQRYDYLIKQAKARKARACPLADRGVLPHLRI
jgi:hypothetical protein